MSLTAAPPYRRDAMTWAVYSGLLAFGFLNAVLGPALPYLRATEHISYLVSAFHQVAFAIGGGLAGLIAVRTETVLGRGTRSASAWCSRRSPRSASATAAASR